MYKTMILAALATLGLSGRYDSRHIEAHMREMYGTLDGLSLREFTNGVSAACFAIDDEGAEIWERIASDLCLA